jgi:hypothetical protein
MGALQWSGITLIEHCRKVRPQSVFSRYNREMYRKLFARIMRDWDHNAKIACRHCAKSRPIEAKKNGLVHIGASGDITVSPPRSIWLRIGKSGWYLCGLKNCSRINKPLRIKAMTYPNSAIIAR